MDVFTAKRDRGQYDGQVALIAPPAKRTKRASRAESIANEPEPTAQALPKDVMVHELVPMASQFGRTNREYHEVVARSVKGTVGDCDWCSALKSARTCRWEPLFIPRSLWNPYSWPTSPLGWTFTTKDARGKIVVAGQGEFWLRTDGVHTISSLIGSGGLERLEDEDDGEVRVQRPPSDLADAKRWLLETFLGPNKEGIRRLALFSVFAAEVLFEDGRKVSTSASISIIDFGGFIPATITYFAAEDCALKWAGVARRNGDEWEIILVPRPLSEREQAVQAAARRYGRSRIARATASGVEKLVLVIVERASRIRLTPTTLGVPGLHIGLAANTRTASAVYNETRTRGSGWVIKSALWSEEKQMTILMPAGANVYAKWENDDAVGKPAKVVDAPDFGEFNHFFAFPIVDAAVEYCEGKLHATRSRS